MSGRGGVVNDTWDGVVPPECQANPLVFRLNAALAWEEAREPLHRDIDVQKTCGVGPGMAFTNSVLKMDPGIGLIGLVPCAIGGTNISEWRRGGRLYNHLLTRAQAALHGGDPLIRGILWYQGESDTINYEDARLYKRRLEKFFNHVRSDLLSPLLPVIQVALASGTGPYVDIIRKAQLGINLPNVRCVDAYGLQLDPDGLHLSTQAQVRLGQMLADAFLQVTAPLPVQSSGANKRFHNFFLDFFLRWFR
ncbi:carbohydrate esterase [Perilla frutescens var. frutescens]|nr:carbohydrate esterase [Perilla frutescens var. frutescens]